MTPVAPPLGAWIEIENDFAEFGTLSVAPPWERGLKFYLTNNIAESRGVAPPLGAWIEIIVRRSPTLPI